MGQAKTKERRPVSVGKILIKVSNEGSRATHGCRLYCLYYDSDYVFDNQGKLNPDSFYETC